jgi:hypothetical protein
LFAPAGDENIEEWPEGCQEELEQFVQNIVSSLSNNYYY